MSNISAWWCWKFRHIEDLVNRFNIIGACASMFVFKGKYRAVLISYLNEAQRENILSKQYREKYETDITKSAMVKLY